ncbi:MAG: hypothetical protein SGPRY_014303, partial [Prymnesium sp.]
LFLDILDDIKKDQHLSLLEQLLVFALGVGCILCCGACGTIRGFLAAKPPTLPPSPFHFMKLNEGQPEPSSPRQRWEDLGFDVGEEEGSPSALGCCHRLLRCVCLAGTERAFSTRAVERWQQLGFDLSSDVTSRSKANDTWSKYAWALQTENAAAAAAAAAAHAHTNTKLPKSEPLPACANRRTDEIPGCETSAADAQ